MDRYVALKILPSNLASDPAFVGRFRQEAKVIAKLQHPHILPVHDFGEAEGYTYIVMPFVQTGTLADLLTGQPLPLLKIRSLISQVGDALDYAHAHGIVHRDVKPSNVLMDERGNCLLSDFGIAKIVEGTSKFTTTGGLVGTPAYMSPEQGLGQTLDGRSDIYSLGVILYEMATGRTPYNAETPVAIVIKHINDPLPLPSALNPALPEALERVILKSLAKRPEDRFATAADMVKALQAAIPDTGAVEPPHGTRAGRTTIPAWVWVAGGLVGLAVLAVLIAVGGGLPSVATQTPAATSAAANSTLNVAVPNAVVPTATLTPTDLPTATPTSTMSPSPAPTVTPTPSSTPTHTPTPTRTPTPTPACPDVSGPFADVWLAVRERLGCAAGASSATDAAEELFQHGWMYWRKDSGRIYAVYKDGRWESHTDIWKEGDPAFSCPDGNTPSGSPPTPIRGFGKIWCTVAHVRQGLGLATEGERALQVIVQPFDRGFILRTDRWTWIFYGDGSWERR
jgi:serine/threonine protein kinase